MLSIEELNSLVSNYKKDGTLYDKAYKEAIVTVIKEKNLDQLKILAACENETHFSWYGQEWPIIFYAIEENWSEGVYFLKEKNYGSKVYGKISQHYNFGGYRSINAFQLICATGHAELFTFLPFEQFYEHDDEHDDDDILINGLCYAICNAREEVAKILIQSLVEKKPTLIAKNWEHLIQKITRYCNSIPCLEYLIEAQKKLVEKMEFPLLSKDNYTTSILKGSLEDNEKIKMLTLLRSINAPFSACLEFDISQLKLLFTFDKNLVNSVGQGGSFLSQTMPYPRSRTDNDEKNAKLFFFLLDNGADLNQRCNKITPLEHAFSYSNNNQYIVAGLIQRGHIPEKIDPHSLHQKTLDTIIQFGTIVYFTEEKLNKLIKQAREKTIGEDYSQLVEKVKNPPINLKESININLDVLSLLRLLSQKNSSIFSEFFKGQRHTIEFLLKKTFSLPTNSENIHNPPQHLQHLAKNLKSNLFENKIKELTSKDIPINKMENLSC